MAISSVSTNYTGRLKDICVLNGVNPLNSDGQPSSLDFGKPSRFCAGVQKLCQKYLILLLTKLGSQEPYPAFGTMFMTALQNRNNNLSGVDAEHLFNVANLSVLNTLRQYVAENPSTPPDEQINTSVLEDFVIDNTSVSLKIRLTTQSGDEVVFLAPLPE